MKNGIKVYVVAFLVGIALSCLGSSSVLAGTQEDMYDTVKEAVENTYTESSYEFEFVGEDDEVTARDVDVVMKEISADYSHAYEINTQNIKGCSKGNLEGYEVTIDVSSLEYQERVAFEKKLNKTVKKLKQKCKGKTKKQKVNIINKWTKANIAVKAKSKNNNFYSAYTSRKASYEGYACVNAYLLCKVGVKARVLKQKSKYYTLYLIGKRSYISAY